MNQEKIGSFISKLRKEKRMTQQELANKLGVTDRAISNWENGRRMPDYSIIMNLCKELNISLNELFDGQKIIDNNYKEVADKNLLFALENSAFTLKDRIKYYKTKWLKEHTFKIVLAIISIILLLISLIIQHVACYLALTITILLGMIFYTFLHNQMMTYVENSAYKKISN
jgi:transcriptional regulator with XRE-family HTH domain